MEKHNPQAAVAVLIPCYNEAMTIEKVVRDFRTALPDAEIYVYDNNSTDDTASIALAAGARIGRETKQGKGHVVKTMLREIKADCYLMVDGDDTYPAEAAMQLVQPILSGEADLVVGDRLSSTYTSENKRPFHNFGNKLVCGLIGFFYRTKVTDAMTGYRAFTREFAENLPAVLSGGFQIETEMTVYAVENHKRVMSVPILYRDRPQGSQSKLHTFSDGAKILLRLAALIFRRHPLRVIGVIAAGLLLIAAVIVLLCLWLLS
ncbi:MAG: glycosyltransferase [Clostridiales bacterium]|jgi:glycosyltransferase involved in cell wall biosynthesis|nr:glycosyltransferase [Clostridiales bacterium]